MTWKLLKFDEFDVRRLYEVLKLRVDVFVVEQNCAYPELDSYDEKSLHLMYIEEDEVVAYCRLIPDGDKYDKCSIGRVIIKQKARGTGMARKLMHRAIDEAENAWNVDTIKLSAQSHLQDFYGSIGFIKNSEEYDEDGIPHVDMIRKKVK
ncbi:GNAT family N-acetyltransferase [Psychrobacillus vulpis]|uniref:GNAT family N-acetyltransferase n=1 Tax=Psychrobacillus vulpis TaxID=2325572 RepID=A0A544TVL3_9BACI|nr:GNAT family N-acetyltransferase [Psychrobacillus vulpis]TQR21489.1 GNAT family N-acetyltransferase [Psychrobacillus vulpis]